MGKRGHVWPRKGSDWWYATINGKQEKLSTDKIEAERLYHQKKAECAKAVQAGITLGGLVDLFMEFVGREREPSSWDVYSRHLKSFVGHCAAQTPASEIQPKHVNAWLASHPTWGANTRRCGIGIVNRMYNWGKKEGHIPANPIRDIEKPASRFRETVLTGAQADTILASVADQPFRDFLTALRETGCRPGEVWTLTADRVDLKGGTWQVINKTRRKTGQKYRPVYLSPAAIELSRRLIAEHPTGPIFRNTLGNPWNSKAIVMRFRKLREKLGMGPEGVAYSFRHLYITDALERGTAPQTVAEMVGHRSLDMIMRVYSKLRHRTDHLREAARLNSASGTTVT